MSLLSCSTIESFREKQKDSVYVVKYGNVTYRTTSKNVIKMEAGLIVFRDIDTGKRYYLSGDFTLEEEMK